MLCLKVLPQVPGLIFSVLLFMGKRLKFSNFRYSKPKFALPKKPKQGFVQHENRRIRHGMSMQEQEWVRKMGFPISSQVIKMPGGKFIVVDAYDPKTNTVAEYLGDFYHGFPLKYKMDSYNTFLKKFNRELYLGTIDRFKVLHELGYNIIFCWESWYKKGFMGRYYYYYDKKTNKWDDLL